MIEINCETYRAVADKIKELAGDAHFINGTVEFETDEFYSELKLSAIVYRRTESLPEGDVSRIDDIVPIWWEFKTVQECGEALNDFSFGELKTYMKDYQ